MLGRVAFALGVRVGAFRVRRGGEQEGVSSDEWDSALIKQRAQLLWRGFPVRYCLELPKGRECEDSVT